MNRTIKFLSTVLLLTASLLMAAGKPVYIRAYNGTTVDAASKIGTTGGIALEAPADKTVVPLLSDGQKAYIRMPRGERVVFFADSEKRKEMRELGYYPLTVTLQWKGEGGDFQVLVSEEPSLSSAVTFTTAENKLELGNFKVATTYYWQVFCPKDGKNSAIFSFTTEADTPRLMRIDGVPNVRDMGGYIGRNGRRVKQGMVYRSAGLNYNASIKYETIDLSLPENAGKKADKEATDAMVAYLKSLCRKFKGHAMACTVGPEWTVFMPGMQCMNEDVYREFLNSTAVPATFRGASAQQFKADVKGVVNLPLPSHDPKKYPAFLIQEFEAPEEGVMQLGCGADWFWAISINGKPLFNVLNEGNTVSTMEKDDYHIALPVNKGKNVLAVVLLNGTKSWRWACGDCNKKEAVVPLLQSTYRSERERAKKRTSKEAGRVMGANRLNDEMKAYTTQLLGIKSDIDLRSDRECYGMEGSPMGEAATWFHYSSSAYGGMGGDGGKTAFCKVFRVFLNKANYPIDFHCIAGQDRTGAVAFITNGLLGVPEEKLYLDWEVTGFWNPNAEFNHVKRFDKLVDVFTNLPGKTINDKIEKYVLDLGFTMEEINAFREIMLE